MRNPSSVGGVRGKGSVGGWRRNLAPLSPHTPHTPDTLVRNPGLSSGESEISPLSAI
ncbi:MAG: hypothetical protein PUP90_25275 [Nostoc sp. S4]|nr:hypothetical protein [Nostoc sp. S4]